MSKDKRQFDFMRVTHGAMSKDEYNKKWKTPKRSKSTSFKSTLKRNIGEEAPTNSAGGGAIAGIGIGPSGEPPVKTRMKAMWRRYLEGKTK